MLDFFTLFSWFTKENYFSFISENLINPCNLIEWTTNKTWDTICISIQIVLTLNYSGINRMEFYYF